MEKKADKKFFQVHSYFLIKLHPLENKPHVVHLWYRTRTIYINQIILRVFMKNQHIKCIIKLLCQVHKRIFILPKSVYCNIVLVIPILKKIRCFISISFIQWKCTCQFLTCRSQYAFISLLSGVCLLILNCTTEPSCPATFKLIWSLFSVLTPSCWKKNKSIIWKMWKTNTF